MTNNDTYLASKPRYAILAILVAYAALRIYDLPVREWLKNKLFKCK